MAAPVMPTSPEGWDRDRAVDHLIARAGRRGFAIAVDLLGDRAEAEDVVQDSLIKAMTSLDQLRDPAALEAWFLRIVATTCIRTLRRRRVRRAFARIVGLGGEPVAPPAAVDADHVKLLRAIDQLPAKQKSALVLQHGHDLGLDEIARVLGISVETVKTHLKRARETLRAQLGVDE